MKKKNSLPNKLRWRLLLNFLMIILLMAIMNVSTISWTSTNYHKLSDELAYHLELHRISIDFIILEEALGSYISSGNQAYKDDVATSLSNIRLEMGFLQKESAYRSPLYYHLYDITNMVSSLTGQINRLYSDYSRGVSRIYIRDQMNSIERHVGYIESELAKVNTIYMDNLQQFYGSFSQTMLFVIRLSLAIILFLVLISILIASRFTNSISQPIHTLATTMLAFGRGDLDASIKPINNNDEISILIDSFNSMGSRIKRLVHSIQEKAKIERQLKLQEIEHQETLRLLRESELARLQSQINPHFLFNTLNTISAVAQIETAPQTNQLIYSLSTLLRYNLKNQNEMVMLEQEIVAVRSYMSIQQMRFGDKITYFPHSFHQAFDLLQANGSEAIQICNPSTYNTKGDIEFSHREVFPDKIEAQLIQAIIHGKGEEAREATLQFTRWLGDNALSVLSMKYTTMELFIQIRRNKALRIHPRLQELIQSLIRVLYYFESREEICNWIPTAIAQIVRATDETLSAEETNIQKILHYIDLNDLGTTVSLENVASFIGLTPQYISRLFKQHFNINFIEYVTQRRINLAADLLKTTDLSVREVSARCGYNDMSYFSKVFSRFIGLTPREYRQQTRLAKNHPSLAEG
jgi:YesN/AraC family two-component response regulator